MTEAKEAQTYTLAEVATRNTASCCWLVIHGKVYDVTKYLEDHPGGEDVLLDVAGKEATDEFEDQGHSETARNLLKGLEVGNCLEKDPKKVNQAKEEGRFPPIKENKMIPTIVRVLLPILVLCLALLYAYFQNTKTTV